MRGMKEKRRNNYKYRKGKNNLFQVEGQNSTWMKQSLDVWWYLAGLNIQKSPHVFVF